MKKNLKKRNMAIAGVVILLVAGGSYVKFANSSVAVESVKIEKGHIEEIVNSTGTVVSDNTAGVYNRQGGFLTQLKVNIGDSVKVGQLVAEITSEDLYYTKASANSRLAVAQAEYKKALEKSDPNQIKIAETAVVAASLTLGDAKKTYEETKVLLGQGAVSSETLDQAKLRVDSAENAKKSAESALQLLKKGVSQNIINGLKANIKSAQNEVDRMSAVDKGLKVYAPISGVVTEKFSEKGAYLAPGSKLFTISDMQKLKIYSDVIDQDLQKIMLGLNVRLEMNSADAAIGKVAKIHPSVFEKTSDLGIVQKRVRVEIQISNVIKPLLLGQDLDVKYIVKEKDDVVLVDKDFVYEDGDLYYVLVNESGLLAKKTVTIGIKGEDFDEVLTGLAANELIVGEVDQSLKIGDRIK
jgi:HlyD family secretion protein